jgi:hypothetical protein
MNDKTADKLYKSGRILLGVLIALSILQVIINPGSSMPLDYVLLCAGIYLLILVGAYFQAKKNPISVGAIFIGYGVFSSAWIIYSSRLQWPLASLVYGSLPSWLLIADGVLFLISGLIRRRNEEKATTEETIS